MKTIIHSLVFVIVIFYMLLSQCSFSDKIKDFKENFFPPDIQFEEKIFDFGVISQGDKVAYIYRFKNVGRKILKIERIRSTCDCTAINLTSMEIEPGNTGEIKAIFDSEEYTGRIMKSIHVHSNDPDEPVVTLKITGIVKEDVVVNPKKLNFGEIYEGKGAFRKLKVLPEAIEKLEIKKLEISSEYLVLKRSEYSEGNREGIEITVTLSPKTPQGRFFEILKIHTNSKGKPMIEVAVYGAVVGRIKVSPKKISFKVEKGDSVAFRFVLNKGRRKRLKINKAKDELGYFEVRLRALKLGVDKKPYLITLKPKSDAPRGSVKEYLLLYTDVEEQPVLRIFLDGIIR